MRHSPRASLGSKHLPWAPARVRQIIIAQPEDADSVRDLVCTKDAGASINLSRVLLPSPLRPIKHSRSPHSICSETLLNSCGPKRQG